jgi:hypothetical protein
MATILILFGIGYTIDYNSMSTLNFQLDMKADRVFLTFNQLQSILYFTPTVHLKHHKNGAH